MMSRRARARGPTRRRAQSIGSIPGAALRGTSFRLPRPITTRGYVSSCTMPTLTRSSRQRRHAVAFHQQPSQNSMTMERTTSTHAALDIGLATDVGRVREANEDALIAVRPDGARDGQVLVAVA